jgi:NAD(P)-dependent dehydrogenase (short-subunit alcohol dehydrogenase family)
MKSLQELFNLKGSTVAITGGAGYLGSTLCETMAEAGSNVVIIDSDKNKTDELIKHITNKFSGNHLGINVDLSNKNDILSIPTIINNNFNNIDCLINCASLVGDSNLKGWAESFDKQDIDTWEKAMSINLTSVFYLIQKCEFLLRKSKSPSIINIASIYGFAGQKPLLYEGTNYLTPAAYASSKGGLIQLTRYLATILSPQIRVNCISPGGIKRDQNKEFINRYEKMTPLDRMGTEQDFRGITLLLASNLSSYITGQNIVVDGGWSL